MLVLARVSLVVASSVVMLAACERDVPPVRPAGLVLVVEGHEYFWGNDQYKTPNNCRDPAVLASGAPCRLVKTTPGVFADLSAALPSMVAAARPDVDAAVIVYGDEADQVFTGAIAGLSPAAIGSQADREGQTQRNLPVALAAALDRLERAPRQHRQLVVVTDGYFDEALDLTPLAKRLDAADVDVTLLVYDDGPTCFDDPNRRARLRALATLGRVVKLVRLSDLRTALPAAVTP